MKTTFMPPIGLWAIRSAASAFADVTVFDMHLNRGLPLPDKEFDLVGISAQFSIQDRIYRKMVEVVRKSWPRAQIIAGGVHAAYSEHPLDVSYVAKGPGEDFFRKGEIGLPYPTASEMRPYWNRGLPHDFAKTSDQWMPIETSRGCWRTCQFCSSKSYWGSWNGIPIDRLTEYLRYLRYVLNVQEVFIEDDGLSLSRKHFEAVLHVLGDLGLSWSAPNGIGIEGVMRTVNMLRPSGCWRLSLPFETGSFRTAGLMGLGSKWYPFKRARDIVWDLNDRGIETCGFFIIGWPGETRADIQDTFDYANMLPLKDRHIYIATPYPGTALLEECKANGLLDVEPPELYDRLLYTEGVITTPEWTSSEVLEMRVRDREAAIARRKAGDMCQTSAT